jgi:glycine C-acetyltransferase
MALCGSSAARRASTPSSAAHLGVPRTEDTTSSSCFDANAGLFEPATAEDAVISDELNHASVIDGIRLCKARRGAETATWPTSSGP